METMKSQVFGISKSVKENKLIVFVPENNEYLSFPAK